MYLALTPLLPGYPSSYLAPTLLTSSKDTYRRPLLRSDSALYCTALHCSPYSNMSLLDNSTVINVPPPLPANGTNLTGSRRRFNSTIVYGNTPAGQSLQALAASGLLPLVILSITEGLNWAVSPFS